LQQVVTEFEKRHDTTDAPTCYGLDMDLLRGEATGKQV